MTKTAFNIIKFQIKSIRQKFKENYADIEKFHNTSVYKKAETFINKQSLPKIVKFNCQCQVMHNKQLNLLLCIIFFLMPE